MTNSQENIELPAIGVGRRSPAEIAPNQILAVILFFAVLFVSIALIAPNYFLFSTDDLSIGMDARPLKALALDQAANGRYTFSAFARLLDFLRVDYPAYLAISGTLFIAAWLFLLSELAAFAKIENPWAKFFGALLFSSFCLNLDLYQFKEAYLSYALSFGFGALAIRFARSETRLVARIALSAICLGLAYGAYQTFLQILIMIMAVWGVSRAIGRQSPRGDFAALTMAAATAMAVALYFLTNMLLKALTLEGFAAYPARPQGARFVLANLHPYLKTAFHLMSPAASPFAPLANSFVTCGFLLLCVAGLSMFTVRASGWKKWAIWAIFAAALLSAPNPANLLMEFYWPSPRSVAGIGFFFAGVAALLLEIGAEARAPVAQPKSAVAICLGLLILTQLLNDAQLLARRSVQQVLDLALARQIVSDVERLAPANDLPIDTRIVTTWHSNAVYRKMPYAYGVSLLGTDWSAPPLLSFVSGGRIIGHAGQPSDCSSSRHSSGPVVTLGPGGLPLVCFPSQTPPWPGSS